MGCSFDEYKDEFLYTYNKIKGLKEDLYWARSDGMNDRNDVKITFTFKDGVNPDGRRSTYYIPFKLLSFIQANEAEIMEKYITKKKWKDDFIKKYGY